MSFTQWSSSEKKQYAKRFSQKEITMYRKGKRNGWLDCYHNNFTIKKKNKGQNFSNTRSYSKEFYNSLIDDPKNVSF